MVVIVTLGRRYELDTITLGDLTIALSMQPGNHHQFVSCVFKITFQIRGTIVFKHVSDE